MTVFPVLVSDGGNGLNVVVSPSGGRSFRYDYRLSGRRETLTMGRHGPIALHAKRFHLAYGMDVTLEEVRLLLARARVQSISPKRQPAELAGRAYEGRSVAALKHSPQRGTPASAERTIVCPSTRHAFGRTCCS